MEWKWVNGYPEYSISDCGIVRRRPKLVKRYARILLRFGNELKTRLDKGGYVRASLFIFDGHKTGKNFLVHRLVAEAFIPNPENKPYVNHKNGIKTDNMVDNLEWVTRIENARHAVKNGLYRNGKGEHHNMAKLCNSDVLEIRRLRKCNLSSSNELAIKYGVSTGTINSIISGARWKHLNQE